MERRRSFALSRIPIGLGLLIILAGCNQNDSGGSQQALAFAQPAPLPELDESTLESESWEVHYLLGAESGYRHTQLHRLPDGRRARKVVDVIGAQRFGDWSQQTLSTVEVRSPQGHVEQLGYELETSGESRSLLGQRMGDQLFLVRQWGDRRESQTLDWPLPEAGFFTIEYSLAQSPIEPGHTRLVRVLVPLFDRQPVDVRLTAGSLEMLELKGSELEVRPILGIFALQDGKREEVRYWIDDTGQIVKTDRRTLDQLTVRSTKEAALSAARASTFDIGRDTRVPLDPGGRDPHRLRRAVYRVRLAEAPDGFTFPTSEGQQVARLNDLEWQVTVSTVQPDSPLPPDYTPAGPGPADLQPAPLIQSNHPRVAAAAQVAIGSADEQWEKAVRIEGYVHRILHVTEFSQAFASAAETVERRRGDCSEHAVLLAACCRAVGIPARLVAGLVYSQQDQGLMYHMWNEVWIKDRWIPLDATLGQGGAAAGHLRISDSQSGNQNIYQLVTPVLRLVGKMQVELEPSESGS